MGSMRAIRSGSLSAVAAFLLILSALAVAPARAQSPASPATPAPADSAAAAAARPDSASAPKLTLGCADGERDATATHNPQAFGLAGLLTGPVGLGIAIWKTPQPDAEKMARVAPAGAAEFARCYGRRARQMNVKSAANGFAIATFTALVINYYLDSKTAP